MTNSTFEVAGGLGDLSLVADADGIAEIVMVLPVRQCLFVLSSNPKATRGQMARQTSSERQSQDKRILIG